jgi:hypothetical protein
MSKISIYKSTRYTNIIMIHDAILLERGTRTRETSMGSKFHVKELGVMGVWL